MIFRGGGAHKRLFRGLILAFEVYHQLLGTIWSLIPAAATAAAVVDDDDSVVVEDTDYYNSRLLTLADVADMFTNA